ncbi:hypothetical protein [Solidesulfovibrio sp.]
MTSYPCPRCGGDAVRCACDTLPLEDQRRLVDALQHEFRDLDHAIEVACEYAGVNSLLHTAAMEYAFKNGPEELREEIRSVAEQVFNIQPAYRGPDGERLFSIEQVAEALGITVEEAMDRAERYLGPEHKRQRDGVTRVQ